MKSNTISDLHILASNNSTCHCHSANIIAYLMFRGSTYQQIYLVGFFRAHDIIGIAIIAYVDVFIFTSIDCKKCKQQSLGLTYVS